MPWITLTDYEPPHECALPSLEPMYASTMADPTVHYTYPAGPGSVWECDCCHKVYEVQLNLADEELEWRYLPIGNPAGLYPEATR